jgi:hypothetical protein
MHNKIILKLLFVWTNLALLFGVQLYFFGNLDNPIVNIIIPLSKDFIWLIFSSIIFILLLNNRVSATKYTFPIIILIVFTVLLISTKSTEVWVTYLSLIKNIFLYIVLSVIVINKVFARGLKDEFILIVIHAIVFSLVISIILYLFHPVQSDTGRLFGTYGNPNSAGFVVSCLFFFLLFKNNIISKFVAFNSFVIGCSVLLLSVSLSTIGSLILFYFVNYLLIFRFRISRIKLKKNVYQKMIFFSVLFFVLILSYYYGMFSQFSQRTLSVLHGGLGNDTISIRYLDLIKTIEMSCTNDVVYNYFVGCGSLNGYIRMDSTFMSYAYNYGYVWFIMFVLVIYTPIFLKYKHIKKELPDYAVQNIAIISLFVTIVLINLTVQHSFELFPTNFLYSILIALSYNEYKFQVVSSKKRHNKDIEYER